jgi:hypothetical protein
MNQEQDFDKQTFDKCIYFRKPECRHSDDEYLMKRLINLMENDDYDERLANEVNELQCYYCEVFEHRQ